MNVHLLYYLFCAFTHSMLLLHSFFNEKYRVAQSFLPKSICLLHKNQWANLPVLYTKTKRTVCNLLCMKWSFISFKLEERRDFKKYILF